MNDRYSMFQHIIDGNEDTETLEKMRLCWFHGLSHYDDRKEILSRELNKGMQRLKREYPHD